MNYRHENEEISEDVGEGAVSSFSRLQTLEFRGGDDDGVNGRNNASVERPEVPECLEQCCCLSPSASQSSVHHCTVRRYIIAIVWSKQVGPSKQCRRLAIASQRQEYDEGGLVFLPP